MSFPDFLNKSLYERTLEKLDGASYAGYVKFSIRARESSPEYGLGSEFLIKEQGKWITWKYDRVLLKGEILRLNPYTSKLADVPVLCRLPRHPTVCRRIIEICREASVHRNIFYPKVELFFRRKHLPYDYFHIYSPSIDLVTEDSPVLWELSLEDMPPDEIVRVSLLRKEQVPDLDLLRSSDGYLFSDLLARKFLHSFQIFSLIQ